MVVETMTTLVIVYDSLALQPSLSSYYKFSEISFGLVGALLFGQFDITPILGELNKILASLPSPIQQTIIAITKYGHSASMGSMSVDSTNCRPIASVWTCGVFLLIP